MLERRTSHNILIHLGSAAIHNTGKICTIRKNVIVVNLMGCGPLRLENLLLLFHKSHKTELSELFAIRKLCDLVI